MATGPTTPVYGLSGQALQDYYLAQPPQWFIRSMYAPRGPPRKRDAAMEAHLAHQAGYRDKVHFAGPILSDDGATPLGTMCNHRAARSRGHRGLRPPATAMRRPGCWSRRPSRASSSFQAPEAFRPRPGPEYAAVSSPSASTAPTPRPSARRPPPTITPIRARSSTATWPTGRCVPTTARILLGSLFPHRGRRPETRRNFWLPTNP